MALVPGEYAFECSECNGDGNIEIGPVDHPDHEWVTCPDCHGDGELLVDEDEAAEMIDDGLEPLRGPST
jgi:DnaJ-class molecular chaperone